MPVLESPDMLLDTVADVRRVVDHLVTAEAVTDATSASTSSAAPASPRSATSTARR